MNHQTFYTHLIVISNEIWSYSSFSDLSFSPSPSTCLSSPSDFNPTFKSSSRNHLTLLMGDVFTSSFLILSIPRFITPFSTPGDDYCGSVCSTRRGPQPCDSPIHPPLQHTVFAHSLGPQPQTDLQSQDTHITNTTTL